VRLQAGEVTLGVILGFTGPIESITPAMADGAELAMAEVNDSGMLWTA
jgi:branched-chain amino acid transport system substrate-binding protein